MKAGFVVFLLFSIFASCKKQAAIVDVPKELYPVAAGNKWIYVDSFFNASGLYYGKDTFTLKVAKSPSFNNQLFTPITDQFDDSIFVVRSTDSAVYIFEQPAGEMLFYQSPSVNNQPVITTSYSNNTYNASFSTQVITYTNFPSYKIVITRDDGQWFNYKQKIFFFSPGIGVIKGSDLRKTRNGVAYTYDSYSLTAFSLY
jgi:hypothetical protein